MALNLWTTGGKLSSYNPLPTGLGNFLAINATSYIASFYASSISSGNLYLDAGNSNNLKHSDGSIGRITVPLTPVRQLITVSFNFINGDKFYIWDKDSKGDIIIDSISLVQAPLPKLTINGVDGFLSGKWTSPLYGANIIDDMTISYLPFGQYQNICYDWIPCFPNTTYTLSASQVDGNGAFFPINFFASDKSTGLGNANSSNNSLNTTFTTPSNCYYIEIGLSTRASSGFTTCTFKNIMLNVGSIPAPYSPKTGDRMVMPFAKNNLLPPLSKVSNQLLNNAVITGNYSLSLSVSDAPNYHSSYFSIPVVSGKTYTVSGVTNDPNACIRVHAGIGFSGALVGGTINSNSSSYFSFTVDDSFNGYASVRLDNNGANGTFNFNSLQVVEGTVPFGIAQENKVPQKHVPKKNLINPLNYRLGNAIMVDNVSYWAVTTTGNAQGIYFNVGNLLPNTNYTVSCSVTITNAVDDQLSVRIWNYSKSSYVNAGVVTTGTYGSKVNLTASFNTGSISSTDIIEVWFVDSFVSPADTNFTFNLDKTVQLEFGSSATSYEPYQLVLPPANKGLSFNGVTDYITFPNSSDLALTTLTMEFLVNFNQLKDYGVLLQKGVGGGASKMSYALWTYASGVTSFVIGDGTTGYSLPVSNTPSNQWLHIVATYDGSTMRSYVNGVLKGSLATSVIPYVSSDSLYIGSYGTTASPNAAIKYINLYNRALSTTEINSRYNGLPITAGLVRNFDFTNQRNIVGTTVMQNAQNLIPSFEDSRWLFSPNISVLGKDFVHLNSSGSTDDSFVSFPVVNGASYLLNGNSQTGMAIRVMKGIQTAFGSGSMQLGTSVGQTFTVDSSFNGYVTIRLGVASSGSFDFIRPQLYQLDGTEGTIYGNPIQLNKPSKRSLYAKR